MTDHPLQHPPYARWAHVLLRIIVGAVLLEHGTQKLFGLFGGAMGNGQPVPMGSIFSYAGAIETVFGALILLGLFTRIAAFIVSGEMAVAYFMVHFPRGFWPITNKGETVVLLCFVCLYLAATGAGAMSLDYIRLRRSPRPVMP